VLSTGNFFATTKIFAAIVGQVSNLPKASGQVENLPHKFFEVVVTASAAPGYPWFAFFRRNINSK
jgi:hypothetical protein